MHHFRHAFWIWSCNFRFASRRYFGWVTWRTAWQATKHLTEANQ